MIDLSVRKLAVFPLLILAMTVAACGGKEAVAPEVVEQQAFDDLRTQIAEVIEDPDRQTKILALTDELQADFEIFQQAVTNRRLELRKLNADYDATREKFQDYVQRFNAQVVSGHDKLFKSHMALIEATTEEEWEALAKSDTKMMKKLISSIQAI